MKQTVMSTISSLTLPGRYDFLRRKKVDRSIDIAVQQILLSGKRPANGYTSLLQSRAATGPKMMFSRALCAISVVVSNLSCLTLSSFFASILPTKRNLLTYLNTVLVYVLTVLVNVLVSESQSFRNI